MLQFQTQRARIVAAPREAVGQKLFLEHVTLIHAIEFKVERPFYMMTCVEVDWIRDNTGCSLSLAYLYLPEINSSFFLTCGISYRI
jgi:hypothetical protein